MLALPTAACAGRLAGSYEERAMAEREYYCVNCGRAHVASRWYVRQATLVGPLLKTDYLCGDAHSHLGPVLQVQWTLLV